MTDYVPDIPEAQIQAANEFARAIQGDVTISRNLALQVIGYLEGQDDPIAQMLREQLKYALTAGGQHES